MARILEKQQKSIIVAVGIILVHPPSWLKTNTVLMYPENKSFNLTHHTYCILHFLALKVFMYPDIRGANATGCTQPCLSSLPVKMLQSIDMSLLQLCTFLFSSLEADSDGCFTSLNVSPGSISTKALWSTMEQNGSPLQITKLICSISFTVGGCDTLHSLSAADEWFY